MPKEWVETINKVNNIDLSVYVPQLIELAKDWTVAQDIGLKQGIGERSEKI